MNVILKKFFYTHAKLYQAQSALLNFFLLMLERILDDMHQKFIGNCTEYTLGRTKADEYHDAIKVFKNTRGTTKEVCKP
jgi:hypothetical protein